MTDRKFTIFQLSLYSIGFLLLFAAWVGVIYFPPKAGGDALITYIVGALGTLAGHILGTVGPSAPASSALTPPVGKAQGGFGIPTFLMTLAIVAMVFVLAGVSGCASLTQAGNTAYSFEPVIGADGKATGGCKFTANDGKEYSSRNIVAASTANGCQVVVQEGASTAFQGQAIAGKALAVLPSFAPILLPPGPASVVPQLQRAAPAAGPAASSGPKL